MEPERRAGDGHDGKLRPPPRVWLARPRELPPYCCVLRGVSVFGRIGALAFGLRTGVRRRPAAIYRKSIVDGTIPSGSQKLRTASTYTSTCACHAGFSHRQTGPRCACWHDGLPPAGAPLYPPFFLGAYLEGAGTIVSQGPTRIQEPTSLRYVPSDHAVVRHNRSVGD
jgi:hypothetical protein